MRIFKQRQRECIEATKASLGRWVEAQNGAPPTGIDPGELQFSGPYVEINAALLETAIDRMLALLGGADTHEFLLKTFERRFAAYKQALL